MKIEFKTHYVEEGSLEFDKHKRWRIDIYIFVPFKTLPKYKEHKVLFKDSFPVKIGCIFQRGSIIGNVPSTIHKFSALIPSFDNCLNLGFSGNSYFFSNDLDELKQIVKDQLNECQNIFKHAK